MDSSSYRESLFSFLDNVHAKQLITTAVLAAGASAIITSAVLSSHRRRDSNTAESSSNGHGPSTSSSSADASLRPPSPRFRIFANPNSQPVTPSGTPVKAINSEVLRGLTEDDSMVERARKHGGGGGGATASCGFNCAACVGTLPKSKPDPFDPSPRTSYLSWDDYFMAVAFLSAQRSKDPNKQVGACIVSKDQVILGIGYNGFPRGCPDSELPWAKSSRDQDSLKTKYPYVCHAEMNAIMNKNAATLVGCKMYVTMFPCNECAKLIIQSGLQEVIYYEDKNVHMHGSPTKGGLRADPSYEASLRLLGLAGIRVSQHRPKKPTVIVL